VLQKIKHEIFNIIGVMETFKIPSFKEHWLKTILLLRYVTQFTLFRFILLEKHHKADFAFVRRVGYNAKTGNVL